MNKPDLTLVGRVVRVDDKGIAILSLYDIKDESGRQEYTADMPLAELHRRGAREEDSFKVMYYQKSDKVEFEVMPQRELPQEEIDAIQKRVHEAFKWLSDDVDDKQQ